MNELKLLEYELTTEIRKNAKEIESESRFGVLSEADAIYYYNLGLEKARKMLREIKENQRKETRNEIIGHRAVL